MRFSRLSGTAFFLMAVIGMGSIVSGQRPTSTPIDSDEVIKVQSRLVVVPVSVTDSNGQPVPGLTAQSFRISEDGRVQEIDQVTDAENTPLEIALLIDVSGSVNPLFDFEIKTAAQFLESVMKPDDRATIFLIGDKPITLAVRENAIQAAARVRTIIPSGKFTAFYDTVSTAAQYLQKNAPIRSRRVILALTDGEDNWSDLTRDAEKSTYRDIDVNRLTQEVRNQLAARTNTAHVNAQAKILRDLQNADTVFYVINPAGDSYKLNSISKRAQDGLAKFAGETGGATFLPRRSQGGPDRLRPPPRRNHSRPRPPHRPQQLNRQPPPHLCHLKNSSQRKSPIPIRRTDRGLSNKTNRNIA